MPSTHVDKDCSHAAQSNPLDEVSPGFGLIVFVRQLLSKVNGENHESSGFC